MPDDLTHIILIKDKRMLARFSSSKPLLNAVHRVILNLRKLHSTVKRLRFASRFADTTLWKFPTLFEVKRTCSQWKFLSEYGTSLEKFLIVSVSCCI